MKHCSKNTVQVTDTDDTTTSTVLWEALCIEYDHASPVTVLYYCSIQ